MDLSPPRFQTGKPQSLLSALTTAGISHSSPTLTYPPDSCAGWRKTLRTPEPAKANPPVFTKFARNPFTFQTDTVVRELCRFRPLACVHAVLAGYVQQSVMIRAFGSLARSMVDWAVRLPPLSGRAPSAKTVTSRVMRPAVVPVMANCRSEWESRSACHPSLTSTWPLFPHLAPCAQTWQATLTEKRPAGTALIGFAEAQLGRTPFRASAALPASRGPEESF